VFGRRLRSRPDSYDLVHARTLFINVPEPETVLAEMVRLTRRGGWVASLEPDCEHSIYCPHHPVFDRCVKHLAHRTATREELPFDARDEANAEPRSDIQ
jgi:ubiquinone/menaquinone biosynthesis C-methylase UbiE